MKKAELEAKLLPNGPQPGEWPGERRGFLNVYVCEQCRGAMVVVLLDWGTTAFMVGCRAETRPGGIPVTTPCNGTAQSRMYRVAAEWGRHVTHAWYRPDDSASCADAYTVAEWGEHTGPQVREHVEKGGLLLRALSVEERATWRAKKVHIVKEHHAYENP